MKIVVLDGAVLNPGDLSWQRLCEIAPTVVYDRTPEDAIEERAADTEVVLTNKTRLSSDTLKRLPNLRYVGVLATGYDSVDVAAARELGITVTNIPAYGTASVAQFVFALLLELCFHVGLHSHEVRSGAWSHEEWSFWKTPLIELSGKTLGLVGLGRIGRQVGQIAVALQMRVIATSRTRMDTPAWPAFRWCTLEELLTEADVVSLHCPLLPETRGIINAVTLAHMKPHAFLINTARGALVIDKDLADALNTGSLAGAAIDVLTVEPPPPDNPLLQAKNCLVTPHMAWATKEARARLMDVAISNVAAFLAGRAQNVVS